MKVKKGDFEKFALEDLNHNIVMHIMTWVDNC